MSPYGTPYPERSLPASSVAGPYSEYEVIKEVPVTEAVVAPAFGEPGLGDQFRLDQSVKWYVDNGYLEEVFR